MAGKQQPEPQASRQDPPGDPPVALGLCDDGDYLRHLGDQIASLDPLDAAALEAYLRTAGALRIST